MGVTRRWGRPWRNRPRHGEAGQMTVEFVVAFPVVVVVAVIAVNAMLFFSECAAFDRVARDAVRQGLEQSRASVQAAIEEALDQPYTDVRVAVEGANLGHVTFTATLEFHPTLFGMGMKSQVFGVSLPSLEHAVAFTIDAYKPGVVA